MKRILFVDDEIEVLEALKASLRRERNQWETVIAIGGEAGLAEMRKQPFDVVVSDLQMPKMNGAQFLEQVQKLSPKSARILLTGTPMGEIAERARTLASVVLMKPIDRGELKAALELACGEAEFRA